MTVLAVSDQIDQRIYSSSIRSRMDDVKMVIGCGDLPARYLEFLADALDKPVYFVLGNHMEEWTRDPQSGKPYDPMGCVNLDARVIADRSTGLILAGLPGSPRYSGEGGQQFAEWQMALKIGRMLPRLVRNRLRRGRWLDILVTHAPPRGVNDRDDVAHRGFASIAWFLRRFKPRYHLHGHIHLYDRNELYRQRYHTVEVINVYPYQKLTLDCERS
ncbi:MAG: metallophosphoesterase [Thermomicrobiales bacterium]|nr:metallophosphoesterase [Thermomicrobiales bacterium]